MATRFLDVCILTIDHHGSTSDLLSFLKNKFKKQSAWTYNNGQVPEELADISRDTLEYIASEVIVKRDSMPQFKDVIGYEKEKDLMREIIILPQKFPHLFTGGRSPFRTVLLFGPSGCGTSFFIKSVAREANVTLFYLDGEKAPINWDRRGEKLMDAVFRVAAYLTPSIIYLNNIDNYAFTRYSMLKTEFILSVHNHVKRGITLIAGSNNPDGIDMAVRRRLEKRVWMKLPDLSTRKKLIERYLYNNELSENDIMTVAERVDGFTHRDIVETIVKVSKKYTNITVEHILDEFSICKRTDEKVFAEWCRMYGNEY